MIVRIGRSEQSLRNPKEKWQFIMCVMPEGRRLDLSRLTNKLTILLLVSAAETQLSFLPQCFFMKWHSVDG